MEYIAYIGICIFWGLSSIAVKLGVESFDFITFNFLRFFISTVVIFIFNIIKRKDIRIEKEDAKVVFLSAFFMYFINSICVGFAAERLDAGIITIFFCLVPLIMVVAQSILDKKIMVGIPGVVGIIGGIVGIVIVSLSTSEGLNVNLIGILSITCGVSSWALGSLYFRNKKLEINLSTLMMYQNLVPFLIYFLIIFANGSMNTNIIYTKSIIGVLYVGIADSILASSLFIFLIKRWKVSVVSTYAYLNPIVGLFASYFILGESISFGKLLGMLIILISVFMIQSDSFIRKFFKKIYSSKLIDE